MKIDDITFLGRGNKSREFGDNALISGSLIGKRIDDEPFFLQLWLKKHHIFRAMNVVPDFIPIRVIIGYAHYSSALSLRIAHGWQCENEGQYKDDPKHFLHDYATKIARKNVILRIIELFY